MFRRSAVVLTAALALQTLPSLAATGPGVVDTVLRTAPLALGQTDAALTDERAVGVTWKSGTARVDVRWHTPTGWTPWAEAEDDTAASPEGTPGTAPQWRPRRADRVRLRTSGSARGLRLVRVADGVVRRVLHVGEGAVAHAATGREVLGTVHPRSAWGADESLRRRAPSYASRVDAVVVHHTAQPNDYGANDVPAMIRADYAYHVRTRGWADLGYNLVVDRQGRVWEGRAGGLGRATVGTHAQGFNTGTLGVAVLGDYTSTTANRQTEKALARVIGHAARTWGFDPAGTVQLTSKGSPRYASGARPTLHRVLGHQATGVTACPGSLQDRLPYLRRLAQVAMLDAPQISSVSVDGAPVHAPTPASVRGRLTRAVPWTVTVTDPAGAVVASARGSNTVPELSWDGRSGPLPAAPGSYRWAVRADDGFHDPATRTGTVEVGLPFLGVLR